MRRVKISEIEPGMQGLEVVGRVVSVGEPRNVVTKFGPATVSEAVIEDETGSIVLTLWRSQIEAVSVGALIRLENTFVNVFRDKMQLNVGTGGRITRIEE